MVAVQPAVAKRPIPRRVKLGIALSALGLVTLVYPGQMIVPISIIMPFWPPVHGCFNFLAPLLLVAFVLVAIGLTLVVLVAGTLALIFTGLGRRGGLVAAVVVDASVVSLLLMTPLAFSRFDVSSDPSLLGLYGLMDVCALFPAAGLALLLSPRLFAVWLPTGKAFAATCVTVGLLLVPGAFGTAEFARQAIAAQYPTEVTTATTAPGTAHAC